MAESDPLQTELARVSSSLDEFWQQRLVFTPSTDVDEVILARDYWASRRFPHDLERFAAARGIPDLAIAASLWNKNYNNALLPAILPAMTALGVGLDASLEHVSLVLKDNIPQAVVLHHLNKSVLYLPRWSGTPAPSIQAMAELSELYQFVFGSLFQHLRSAIAQINQFTRLPRSVMWGNTGNACNNLYSELANCPGAAIAASTDRAIVFDRPESPAGTGRNPLCQTVVYKAVKKSGSSPSVPLRRTCCLLFRMPNSHYCDNCPIKIRADGISVLSNKPLSKHAT
ncbi:MAG: siderophore-iron reductase FhuF [Leptolyngbya sp. DLM2.Bin27]|nr:MAG: siderophore-iron reductase FhuF [Leptolyngbya sp. DLM2.Bin27]